MGRFHRHEDGTVHDHEHEHEHGDHSHYGTGAQRVEVLESIFAENDLLAEANRKAFDSCGVRAVNLMSSPGAGKTTILQATLDELAGEFAIVVRSDLHGHGLGRLLMACLLDFCRARGLASVHGVALADNVDMHRLARACGFQLLPAVDGNVEMVLALAG